MYHNLSNAKSSFHFPASLKYVNVCPTFKKDEKLIRKKPRPFSILPNISKVCERLMYEQLCPYYNEILQRGLNAEQCLICTIENGRKFLILVIMQELS